MDPTNSGVERLRNLYEGLPTSDALSQDEVANRLNEKIAQEAIKTLSDKANPEPKPLQRSKEQDDVELVVATTLSSNGKAIITGKTLPSFSKDVGEKTNAKTIHTLKLMDGMMRAVMAKPPSEARTKCIQELKGLISKSFAPVIEHGVTGGSPGSPLQSKQFMESWTAASSNPQSLNEEIALKQLSALLTLAENSNGEDWSSGNALHHEMASVAALCARGQLLNDFVFEPKFAEFHADFIQVFGANQLAYINEASDRTPVLRKNPLLAEVSKKTRLSDVQLKDANGNVTHNPQILNFLKGSKAEASPEDEAIAGEIEEALIKVFESQYVTGQAIGARGRGQNPALAKEVNPHLQKGVLIPANMALMTSAKGALLGASVGTDAKFEEACRHGSVPVVALNTGRLDPFSRGLDLTSKGIDDPQLRDDIYQIFQKKLPSDIQEILSKDPKELNESEAERSKEAKKLLNLQTSGTLKAIKQIPITMIEGRPAQGNIPAVPTVKLSVDQMAVHPSMVQMIQHQGLSTICGPSGTTVDIFVGLIGEHGAEKVKEILSPLLEMAALPDAQGKVSREIATPDDEGAVVKGDWQGMLSSIAGFMQAGRYHSTAEALGGMWIVAAGLQEPPLSTEEILTGYNRLLQILSHQPAEFLGVQLDGVDAEAVRRVFTIIDPEKAKVVLEQSQPSSVAQEPAASAEKSSSISSIMKNISSIRQKLFKGKGK